MDKKGVQPHTVTRTGHDRLRMPVTAYKYQKNDVLFKTLQYIMYNLFQEISKVLNYKRT